ncbi:MAG TPA: RNA polymerase sigma factor [Silvibacterium sp.]|nr:RNA polymerase sigma factor [Silvibacterium sp.]
MSYAAAMTWEMDGFRVIRSRPRFDGGGSGVLPSPRLERPAREQARENRHGREQARQGSQNPGALPGRSVAADSGMGRVRGAERALEVDWQIVVQRCLDGDSGAWTELVKAHYRRIYGLCYRFTGSSHDAEDLTQDVFLKVYGNLAAFDLARGSFQTWITTVTRNLLVDHFRRTKGQRSTDSMDAGWDEPEDLTIAARLAAGGPTQHDRAAQKEIARMVQEALTRISPELREAVILRDLQDMDYKEIAQVLRIPEGTVKSRISRGRAELARLLDRNKGQAV